MPEHLSDQTIDRYRQQSLPPNELLATNDHLASCEACYLRFSIEDDLDIAYMLARTSVGQLEGAASDHLVYEQITAYLDNELSAEEAALLDSHLKDCGECKLELGELRSLKETLSDDELVAKESATLWHRQPAYRLAFWTAATAAVVVALIWMTVVPLSLRVADLETQVADLRQDNERLRGEYTNAQLALAELKTQIVDHSVSSPERTDIVLNDGDGKVTLDGKGKIGGLKALSSSYEQLLKNALVTERVTPPPIIAKLQRKPGKLMGEAGDDLPFRLERPVGVVVLSDRPAFRWSQLSGASGYIVSVYGPNSKEVATSPLLSSTEWTPPVPLPRGRIYAWQVRAIKDGEEIRVPPPAAADVKFQVLDGAKASELARVTREHGNHHLLLGVLYTRVGLLEDAEREFTTLITANPKSHVAQRLLDSIRFIRR